MWLRTFASGLFGSFCGLALACAGVGPGGLPIFFGHQENVIIWDSETKTEQFIRKAGFVGQGESFGFVAPTPTKPEIDSLPEDFMHLFYYLKPFVPAPPGSRGGGGGVEVIEFKKVAGYEATVVRADDSKALQNWMDTNGFENSADIAKWADFYIKKKWYLTLFKVIPNSRESSMKLVRLTFKSPKPFNPYIVPESNISKQYRQPIGLYVHFVADSEYQLVSKPWNRTMERRYTEPMDTLFKQVLFEKLKTKCPSHDLVVTGFEDPSFPVKGAKDDLWFEPVQQVAMSPTDSFWSTRQ